MEAVMDVGLEQVGPRLRAARRQQGLTLDELAARAQMSASTLSRLESGKRQANLELLVPLTRQLGIRIDDLIPSETPDPRIRQAPIRRDGMLIVPLTASHAPIHTFKITYPAMATTPKARVHDGYEWLYVLQGRLRLRLGERDLTLTRGEAAEFDTRTPHAMAAIGGRPAEVLSIFNEDGARMHTHAADEAAT
ncbi:MAG TPA: XRE family transcriptional regulator [Acidimicrobiales bacterium]|nr:XRE family transcriptional regulator [Acidimicrobiales bacterium]